MRLLNKFFGLMLGFAVIISCSKDETPEITNLDFTITTGDNPLEVSVDPSANGAESFAVYFDAAGDPNTSVATTGDAVSHTYPAASASYSIKVVASSTNGAEDQELTKTHQVSYTPPRSIADFETDGAVFFKGGDAGISFTRAANPNTGGSNASANAGQIVNGGAAYEAAILYPGVAIDMTQDGKKSISFDFYQETDQSLQILVKLEGTLTSSDGIFDVEVEQSVSGAGWQSLSFDFENDRRNSFPNGDAALSPLDSYEKLVLFIGFGAEVAGTFYVDNIGGGSDGASIADTDGDGLLDTYDGCRNDAGPADNNGCPVITGPTEGASIPAQDAADVVAIFSDSYTAATTVANWTTSWGVNLTSEEYEIASGDIAREYNFTDDGNISYTGVDLATYVDATGMTHIHVDAYSETMTTFDIKVVDFGADGAYGGGDDSEGIATFSIGQASAWVGGDVSLASLSALTGVTNIAQFVIQSTEAGTLFLDNLYFYNNDAGNDGSLRLTVSVPEGTTAVRLTGPWWSWDPNGGPIAEDNGDNTWTVVFEAAPDANMEYLWIVDGVQESLVDNAANAECTSRIDGNRMVTDYANYANRVWLVGDGNLSEVYDSCQ